MDYAFFNALTYVIGFSFFMIVYDIMCQWYKKFACCLNDVQAILNIPKNFLGTLTLKCAIGLFHVYGHVKECYAHYASTFIRGVLCNFQITQNSDF